MALYLGFDVRSDNLTAIVIAVGATRQIVFHRSIDIDSPLMWEDALDRVMSELATAAELDFDDLRGISGSASGTADESAVLPAAALLALRPSRPLAPQLRAIASDDELRGMRESPRSFFTQLLSSSYWQRRYSIPRVRMVAWETTHASTLIGTGIIRPGLLLVSLGTEDTLGDVNGVLTFRNGSLVREWMRREHQLDANAFASLLEERPGNDGYIMLPWREPEMTPMVKYAGVRRFGFDRCDTARNVRGLVEGQVMAMANHAPDLGSTRPDRVIVTGAEAADPVLLQVVANIFGADVYRLDVGKPPHDAKSASWGPGNAAALGAALRAYQADRLDSIEPVSWKTVVSVFTEPNPGHRVAPNPRHVAIYAELRREYAILERLHRDRPPIC